MGNVYKQPFDSLTEMSLPGIFVLECIPKKKAYFQQCLTTWPQMREFLDALRDGDCPNPELLADYQTYGFEKFRVDVVETSYDYLFEDQLESALLRIKNSWAGELY